jgi:hypothetical protein
MNGTALNLNEVILLNLNCLEQGIISKTAAHESIIKTVTSNIINILEQQQYEENFMDLLQTLHDKLGLSIVIHKGAIEDVTFEPCTLLQKGA